ncbi:signal peptidase I [Haloterrigena sp. SYSU A558-1]|uniref:Signal peptidase I n=1 Tax=Haloterrigena gelatinilytica TaxID=2741724 RepID=A0ABX2LGK8_9EURY|nr:signal peptidase I [Haloterrigena gelatinilytica]NUC74488.1 signal peptidase I [Haloterrigena gelatinilytica]
MIHRGVTRVFQGLVLASILALFAGQILGQPILLGFVETGSMEPTIETGHGFVAVPAVVTDDPEPGDVIVFEAEAIDGGGLTTHRVVEETERGYVTRGDANPVTDQDSGEPPVQDGQIVASAWRPTGEVVTIPHLGTAVMTVGDVVESTQSRLSVAFGLGSIRGTSGLAYLGLGLSGALYAIETVRERRSASDESRLGGDDGTALDPRLLCGAFALLVVVAAAGAMLVPAGTQSYGVVSAEFDSEQALVIERGTTETVPYVVANDGAVPVVSYVETESDRVAVDEGPATVGPRDDAEVPLSISAPAETGHYPAYVTEYRYLHVLPLPVIDALHDVHPWSPVVVIVSLLGGLTYGVGRRLCGPRDPRSRRDAARDRQTKTRSLIRRRY